MLEVKVKLFIGAKKMLVKLTLGLSEKRHINGTIAQFLSLLTSDNISYGRLQTHR